MIEDELIIVGKGFGKAIVLSLASTKCKMKIHSSKRLDTTDRKVVETLMGQVRDIEWLDSKERPVAEWGESVTKWDLIRNPDGEIRWIYPTHSRRPYFLTTYNSPGLKAMVYVWIVQLLFLLKMSRWVRSGSLTIIHTTGATLGGLPVSLSENEYGIFTGTVGPNRKAIVALAEEGEVWKFAKVAIGPDAAERILHEAEAQEYVAGLGLKRWVVPQGFVLDKTSTLVENIKRDGNQVESKIGPEQWQAVFEMTEATLEASQDQKRVFFRTIEERLNSLRRGAQLPGLGRMVIRLQDLFEQLKEEQVIPFAYAHGDLTPWNMYRSGDTLRVYDWEMAGLKPALYDLFHYVFQAEVLVKHQDYPSIRTSLASVFGMQGVRKRMLALDLDPVLQLHLYLLEAVSANLLLFQAQGTLHKQAWWLMGCWAEALESASANIAAPSCRGNFLQEFSQKLRTVEAAVMRGPEGGLETLALGSDLDLLCSSSALQEIRKWTQNHPQVLKQRSFKQSFMERLELHFVDGGFLSLDLLTDLRRKGLRMLETKRVLARSVQDIHGIRRIGTERQLEYALLFYGLNRHLIPGKYVDQFAKLPTKRREEFGRYIQQQYDLSIEPRHLRLYSRGRAKQIRRSLRQNPLNRGLSRIKLMADYGLDVIRRMVNEKGMVITFSGVDGAGKSTVMTQAAEEIASSYRRKIKVLRHRPSLFPILSTLRYGRKGAETRATDQLPRKGGNRNFLSSAFRFAWYYTDYLIGQWYIWLRYERRGYVVLYDRYFFDMIADPERTNFRLPRGFLRLAARLIRRPDLNFLLTADPAAIRARKQELEEADIRLLTTRYRNLFREMSSQEGTPRFITLHNQGIDASVHRVIQAYRQVL